MKYRILILALLFITQGSRGDVLELAGGESFSGTVVRVVEGALVFRSSLSGQIMVPMDTVDALSTNHFLMLTMKDGAVLYGRLGNPGGEMRLTPIDGSAPNPILLADIGAAVVIPPTSRNSEAAKSPALWSAAVAGGALLRAGSASSFEPSARLEISRNGTRTEFRSDVLVSSEDGAEFPDYVRGSASIARRSGGAVPYIEFRADRNVDAGLKLRAELNLGLRWPLKEKSGGRLEGYAGLSVAYEQWEARRFAFSPKFETEEGDVNLHLGLRYAEGGLRGELVLYPNLGHVGDIRMRANTSYTKPVTPRLRLRLDLLLDYDSAPPFPGMSEWEAALGDLWP